MDIDGQRSNIKESKSITLTNGRSIYIRLLDTKSVDIAIGTLLQLVHAIFLK